VRPLSVATPEPDPRLLRARDCRLSSAGCMSRTIEKASHSDAMASASPDQIGQLRISVKRATRRVLERSTEQQRTGVPNTTDGLLESRLTAGGVVLNLRDMHPAELNRQSRALKESWISGSDSLPEAPAAPEHVLPNPVGEVTDHRRNEGIANRRSHTQRPSMSRVGSLVYLLGDAMNNVTVRSYLPALDSAYAASTRNPTRKPRRAEINNSAALLEGYKCAATSHCSSCALDACLSMPEKLAGRCHANQGSPAR